MKKSCFINYICRGAKGSIALGLLMASSHFLQAEWTPEECLPDYKTEIIKNQEFKDLKAKVVLSLANSWCSAEKVDLLMDLIYITRPKTCVEVGACTGSSVLPVALTLKHINQGKIFAIDAWSNAEAIKYLDLDDPNRDWWSKVDMNSVHNLFQKMTKDWSIGQYCIVIRNSSEKAVQHVDNIDFLHLDGDYSERGALEDVNRFLPKVKSGGYILLSNLFTMVKGKAPKMKAFYTLFDSCEMICEIEKNNTVLFRKQ